MNRRDVLLLANTFGLFGYGARPSLRSAFPHGVACLDEDDRLLSEGNGGLALRHGSSERVQAVEFSRDGSLVLTGVGNSSYSGRVDVLSLDGSGKPPRILRHGTSPVLRVWDAATGEERSRFEGHLAPILAARFGPDPNLIVSGGVRDLVPADERFRANEVDRRKDVYVLNHGRSRMTVPDGAIVKTWDATTGREVHSLAGSTSPPKLVAWGRYIASLGYDNVLTLWEPGTDRPIRIYVENRFDGGAPGQWPNSSLDVNIDATRFVSVVPDGGRFWDAEADEALVARLEGAIGPVVFGTSADSFVTWGRHGAPMSWDFEARKLMRTFARPGNGAPVTARVTCLVISPDSSRVASCDENGCVNVWSGNTGDWIGSGRGEPGTARDAVFLPDGRVRVATGGWDRVEARDPEVRGLVIEPLLVWDVEVG